MCTSHNIHRYERIAGTRNLVGKIQEETVLHHRITVTAIDVGKNEAGIDVPV